MRMRLVVVGHGMVGHRLVETVRAARRRHVRDHRAGRGAAAGLRPGPAVGLVRRRGRSELSACGRRRPAPGRAGASVSTRPTRTVTDRRRHVPVRRAGAGHRVVPVRAAGARPRPRRAASSTAPSTTSTRCRRTPPARRTGVVVGGGLLGLEAANALRRLGLATHVVEFAPAADAAAGRRGRRRDAAPARRGPRPDRPHRTDRCSGSRAGRRPGDPGGASPTAACSAPTWSCSPPASGRATTWPARPGSPSAPRGGVVVDDGLPHVATRTSTRSASAPRSTAGCTAWSRPGYAMAEVVADRLLGGDADVPRRRHLDQAQAARRRRRLVRRRTDRARST